MRIWVVCFTGDSGLTDYSVSLCRALSAKADIRLVTGVKLPDRFRSLGFKIDTPFRRSRHFLIDIWRLVLRILRERPDAVIFQSWLKLPVLEGFLIAMLKRCGIKFILTVHDVLPHYPRPWSRVELGWYFRRFDGIVVHSARAGDELRRMGCVQPSLTVPHGVYDLFVLTQVSRSDARRKIGVENDEFVILFFGHLEPRKGVLEVIAAAKEMAQVEGVRFVLAGSDEMTKHGDLCKNAIVAAGAMPNVTLRAERIPFEEVENYFVASDVVVLPYREGTTSGVLKLALAFKVPVIATKIGDLASEISPSAGLLIDEGQDVTASLIGAIVKMRSDIENYRSGVERTINTKDWGSIGQSYLSFAREVVRKRVGEPDNT